MLVIKIELWPGGEEQYKTVIARAGIGNLSALADVSDYEVVASESASRSRGRRRGRAAASCTSTTAGNRSGRLWQGLPPGPQLQ